jgi:hypothetical protein
MANEAGGSGNSMRVSNGFIQKLLQYMGKEEIRKRLHDDIVDPLLDHIMKRVFPYLLLTCILFIVVLLTVLFTLGVVIFHLRNPIPVLAAVGNIS